MIDFVEVRHGLKKSEVIFILRLSFNYFCALIFFVFSRLEVKHPGKAELPKSEPDISSEKIKE